MVELAAPPSNARHARLLGVGAYRPRRKVSNEEILQYLDSTEEWIRRRSGIVTRHFADKDETLVMMSKKASRDALAMAGVDASRIDAVIVATSTVLRALPHVAPEIAYHVGAVDAAAFDISVGCAGFVHGVALARDLIFAGSAKLVLVVAVERLTDVTDVADRSTGFLLGDGAGAVVIGESSKVGIGPVVWGADGSRAEVIWQTRRWDELRESYESRRADYRWPSIGMNGKEVFRWAAFQMAKVAKETLHASGVDASDLDAFIPHQANMRIIETLTKAMGLPEGIPVARDIENTGNTGGASIPLAMQQMIADHEVSSGDVALILGFGAGLAYAGTVVTLP